MATNMDHMATNIDKFNNINGRVDEVRACACAWSRARACAGVLVCVRVRARARVRGRRPSG